MLMVVVKFCLWRVTIILVFGVVVEFVVVVVFGVLVEFVVVVVFGV